MIKAIVASVVIHSILALVLGVCPWFDQKTESVRNAIDVDVMRIGEKSGGGPRGESKTPQATRNEKTSSASSASQVTATPVDVAPAPSSPEQSNSEASGSVTISGGDGKPQTLTVAEYLRWVQSHNEQPEYPRIARIRGEQGRAVVKVVVSRAGSPAESITLETSSGSELLDRVALEAVQRWRFPAFQSANERISLLFPFKFSLQD